MSGHLVFKATDVVGFTFALHWFVIASKSLREFLQFVVG